ncbi:O-demethylpuromycin-O-methyltransferase [Streptomyces davaonensis JCM 4913]|uniref:O-demethylpuromycin-O-methyltransferase n=1 Tax=Streptomyces davaonensis (strain DSM 101723 / JCM 4913 / KCC S-0913 / 768) TaxID=1214101 RepID=K4RAP5_STRDJ|nr:methyltransferase [Streptomyces davaonensis]CCK30250.1 O-demethylpuromycin-O-methyltransferase [Streptomyces davaonensis JCM 4913]
MRPEEADAAVAVRALLYAPLVSRALCAVAELGIPDALADGPRTAARLARDTGAHEAALHQALTALTAFEVFEALPDGRFALARLGTALTTSAPGSALPSALMAQALTARAWQGIPDTVRTGTPAFDQEFGADFFAVLDQRPDLRDLFDATQARDVELESAAILRAHDFSTAGTLVDVGGGDGALLCELLAAHPELRGVLLDRPAAAAAARARFTAAGLADRAETRAGDFFTAVPDGGDVYLLREILHDWDDEQCVTVLAACRRAMPAHARLVVVELAADDRPGTDADARMTALMTLYMLSVLPGRERTPGEFEALFGKAGLRLTSVTRLTGQKTLLVAVPEGATPEPADPSARTSRERSTDHV